MRSGERSRGRGSAYGQSLVEFAMVVPIFLLLLFGLIEVGRYVYLNNAFNAAAREGARFGSVEQWRYACPKSVRSPNRITCTEQVTRERVAGAPATFDVKATCSEVGANGKPNTVLPAQCGANDLLTVKINTRPSGPDAYHFLTPIIGQLIGSPVIAGQAQVVVQ
jgi:Flp pilus assembly protein TadG